MDDRMNRITAEIAEVVERNLRRELLREREAMLRGELEAVRAELGRIGAGQPIHRAARKPVPASQPQPTLPASSRPVRGASARALITRTLKYARRPMTIKELTKAIIRKGWKTTRKYPTKTVDAALRKNPQDFRRTAPSTFELNR
ncbi:MAG: HTH domain-containing protein [candidate division WOR-3 bacterium]|nr:HTH domain-containing protein [candidate division WOR-3 bacterium]